MRAESVAPCRCAVTERADLRLGRWQDVLSDVECDTLIVDAPYSDKTHSAYSIFADGNSLKGHREIGYASWSAQDVSEFVAAWAPRVNGWLVSVTDHVLAPAWADSLEASGRYVFAPLPMVESGSRVRLAGDGPSSWTCWIIVARPRSLRHWGTLPGAYIGPSERKPVMGGKPLRLMRALVRDYSRPGDLVCDPCAGGGTTLLAALTEGRRAVGAEMDPAHYDIARKRLAKGYTPPLFADSSAAQQEQIEMPGMAHRGRDGDE